MLEKISQDKISQRAWRKIAQNKAYSDLLLLAELRSQKLLVAWGGRKDESCVLGPDFARKKRFFFFIDEDEEVRLRVKLNSNNINPKQFFLKVIERLLMNDEKMLELIQQIKVESGGHNGPKTKYKNFTLKQRRSRAKITYKALGLDKFKPELLDTSQEKVTFFTTTEITPDEVFQTELDEDSYELSDEEINEIFMAIDR